MQQINSLIAPVHGPRYAEGDTEGRALWSRQYFGISGEERGWGWGLNPVTPPLKHGLEPTTTCECAESRTCECG